VSDDASTLDVSKASAASSKLQLQHIALFSLEAQAHRLPERVNLNFDLGHRETIWNVIGDSLICVFGLDVGILSTSSDPPIRLASFSVCFRAEYKMGEAYNPATDDELLPHYAGVVARLHVWPYMRAEVQELTGKLGLPSLTLPVLMSGGTVNFPVRKHVPPPDDQVRAPRKVLEISSPAAASPKKGAKKPPKKSARARQVASSSSKPRRRA